ncbi:RiPP maturation radical SAM C-methyltransferase [Desulfolucanica intricata]|uniref:RiPP maturation radical SAM C-methyltransferase n=1 Tax=Desulfolucanica intricata TaxID=1285191 RepID=UPI00082A6CC8|nr:RiPP maturation radical SAM C-methyltransferase [Desulfolucanica intricata]
MAVQKIPRILLIQMPWATTQRPSISLGIIASLCIESGVQVKTIYPNMDMADILGFEAAGRFANERSLYGLSEHFFAVDIFGVDVLQSNEYLEGFSNILKQEESVKEWTFPVSDPAYLLKIRDQIIPQFLDQVLERVLEYNPEVVGFSATFNQVMSSLALANRIKKIRPEIKIIVGGASFDGEMGQEYHRAMPQVLDHVFLGEAEESFREYLRRLKTGEAAVDIPGVTSYINGEIKLIPGEPLQNMNLSPMPNYDDFFNEAERLKQTTGKVFNIKYLSFEGSRGCWWGDKSQCLFCGMNPETMKYRTKDVERVISEVVTLAAKYRATNLSATDLVMPKEHCERLFQRFKELDLDIELFYEVRVTMTKKQIKEMWEAGVSVVQPGIESFSTPVLKIMRKGTTALRNIQFLRWTSEIGIQPIYNILAGLPGEEEEWYYAMANLIKKIIHLTPPKYNMNFIELHRFSPLYYRQGQYGIDECSIRADYAMNFPEGMLDPMKIAYFFRTRYKVGNFSSDYIKTVREEIDKWKHFFHRRKGLPAYTYRIGPGFISIIDERFDSGRFVHLADLHHDVALLCDEIQTRQTLKNDLIKKWPEEVENGTLDKVIDELINKDILIEDSGQILLLPIGVKYRDTAELRNYILG